MSQAPLPSRIGPFQVFGGASTSSTDPSAFPILTPQPNIAEPRQEPEAPQVARAPKSSVPPFSNQAIPRVTVWNVPFHQVTMEQTLDAMQWIIEAREPQFAITANLHYAMLHAEEPRLAEITRHAALVLADGMPVIVRSRFNQQRLPERVAGADLIYRLAERASQRGYRMFFLGAAPGVAVETAKKLQALYPKLQVAGCMSPPFRKLSSTEQESMIQEIRDSRPDILLVAFGQPKGEYWIAENFRKVGAPLSIQLGASFDFVAGTSVRAPKLWQRFGMEWLYRLLKEPKRLGPRYFQNGKFLIKTIVRESYTNFWRWLNTP